MKNKDKIILEKIINYINDVEEYIKGFDEKEFFNDKKTIMACAFSVSQIGELVKEINDEIIIKYNNIPWNSIKGMRNRIVHDYENVNLAVLWNTINLSLPELRDKMIIILKENENGTN